MLKKLLASLLCSVMVAQTIPVYALTALPTQSYEGVQEENAYPDQYAIPYEDGSIEPTWIPNPHTFTIVGGKIVNVRRYDNDRQGNEYDDHRYDNTDTCNTARGKDIITCKPLCGFGPTSDWVMNNDRKFHKERKVVIPKELAEKGLAHFAHDVHNLDYMDCAVVVAVWCLYKNYDDDKIRSLSSNYRVDPYLVQAICRGDIAGATYVDMPGLTEEYTFEMPELTDEVQSCGEIFTRVVKVTEFTANPMPAIGGAVTIGGSMVGKAKAWWTPVGYNQGFKICQHTTASGTKEHDKFEFTGNAITANASGSNCTVSVQFNYSGYMQYACGIHTNYVADGNYTRSGMASSSYGAHLATRAAKARNYSVAAFPTCDCRWWQWTNGDPGHVPEGFEWHEWSYISGYKQI